MHVLRDGVLLGEGRWTGAGITARPPLPGEPLDVVEEIYRRLEAGLIDEIDRMYFARPPEQNAEGVDLLLIDEMLRLSPRERLLAVQENVASVVEMMARVGHPAD